MTDNEIKIIELDKTVRENEIVRQTNENRRIKNESARESAEAERGDRFESSMARWQSDIDSLLAIGRTYEARISALEAIVRHTTL